MDLFAISSFGKNSLVFINLQDVDGDGPGLFFQVIQVFMQELDLHKVGMRWIGSISQVTKSSRIFF